MSGNRDDTTCLIHDFYRVARPVGGGRARRGHYARGIVAPLDPTAPCPHRDLRVKGCLVDTSSTSPREGVETPDPLRGAYRGWNVACAKWIETDIEMAIRNLICFIGSNGYYGFNSF